VNTQRFDGWTDAALMAAARGGERDAFGELIVRHRRAALAVTARLLVSQNPAGDAVQEASMLAMTGLDRLRQPKRFRCLAVRDPTNGASRHPGPVQPA
jgi:DNA-directed RNA polymerase specialized sigma24 family protein